MARTLQPQPRSLRPSWARVRALANVRLRSPWARALVSPLVSPRKLDDYLQLVDPCWSLDQIRARVIAVERETDDVVSLLLEPNENWAVHRAGQHVLLTAEIDGVRHTRSFSLSNAPGEGTTLRVTVKAHAGGCVSLWARDRARAGDVLILSRPQGDFVLPEPPPPKLLFVSGGSGITPLVAMGQQLARAHYAGDLIWVHSDRDQVPLERDVRELVSRLPNAVLHLHRSRIEGTAGSLHLGRAQLTAIAPDWQQRELFVCGPRGLTELLEGLYGEAGLASQVHSEDYLPRWMLRAQDHRTLATTGRLIFTRSGRETRAQAGVTLLEQAERAGLHPAHGCRRGICHSCKCKKLLGTVRNELTGRISSAPNEEIQVCIHTPIGDVRIEL